MTALTPEIAFFLGFVVYLIYLGRYCWFQVDEGHVAVISTFGKIEVLESGKPAASKPSKSLVPLARQAGIHFKWPWQKVHDVSLMEQMLDLSGEDAGSSAMASDGTMLRFDSKLRITPKKELLYEYLFSMEQPTEHVKSAFRCLLQNEIANFDSHDGQHRSMIPSTSSMSGVSPRAPRVGAKASDEAGFPHPALQSGSYAVMRRERSLLNQRIQAFCGERLGSRYGINFNGVDLANILPPDELALALNGVINAQSEAMRLYAQTESECVQRIHAAEKGLAIAHAKAEAVKGEIETMASLLKKLQDNETLHSYVDRRRAEVFSDSRLSYMKRSL